MKFLHEHHACPAFGYFGLYLRQSFDPCLSQSPLRVMVTIQ